MALYYSIRVIEANSKAEAFDKLENEDFNEDNELCDRILSSGQVVAKLTLHQPDPNTFKKYWFAVKKQASIKFWNEAEQSSEQYETWDEAVKHAYYLSSENKAPVRVSESSGFDNQGHYFLANM